MSTATAGSARSSARDRPPRWRSVGADAVLDRRHRLGGQRVAPRHGGVHSVSRQALDRVGRRLDGACQRFPDRLRAAGAGRATLPAPRSGGLPTPMRTRRKSGECRCAWTDRSPLWPARPPPDLRRTVPAAGRARRARSRCSRGRRSRTAWPGRARPGRTRSCRWSGRRGPRGGRRWSRRRTGPPRPSPPATPRRAARASSSTVSDPALCRLPANSAPGLPSPTTSRSAGVPRRSVRAKGRRRA